MEHMLHAMVEVGGNHAAWERQVKIFFTCFPVVSLASLLSLRSATATTFLTFLYFSHYPTSKLTLFHPAPCPNQPPHHPHCHLTCSDGVSSEYWGLQSFALAASKHTTAVHFSCCQFMLIDCKICQHKRSLRLGCELTFEATENHLLF